jgi:uncharacterized protein YjbI with pentapeptide repeats
MKSLRLYGRFLGAGLRMGIAVILISLLSITPVWAQKNTVDYTLTNVTGRDFSHTNLAGTSFAGAEARDTNFEQANLSGTILTKANFIRANLKNANLSGTFADRVVFDGADMTNAVFIDAIATSSTFNDVEITGADFSNTILDRYQVTQLCQRAAGINAVTEVPTRESLGCRD